MEESLDEIMKAFEQTEPPDWQYYAVFFLILFGGGLACWASIKILVWVLRKFKHSWKGGDARKRRDIILWFGIAFFVLAGIFPPQDASPGGYGFIAGDWWGGTEVDAVRLIIAWILIAGVTAAGMWTVRDRKNS